MRPALLSFLGLAVLALAACEARAQGKAHAAHPPPQAVPPRLPVLLFAACVLVFARPAGAQPAPAPARTPVVINYTVELDLDFGRGAGNCPSPPTLLHDEVRRRLGYDPFLADPQREPAGRYRGTIAVDPKGRLAIVLEFFQVDSSIVRASPYYESGMDRLACEGLMKTIASVVADELEEIAEIAQERTRAMPAPEPKPTPKPEPKPEPVPLSLPAPPPPAPHRWLYLRWEVGLAGFGSFGVGSQPTLGGALHAGVSIAPSGPEGLRFGLAAEGRMDGAATDAYGIQTQLFAGALVACAGKDLHEGSVVTVGFLGCLVFMAGDLRAAEEARGYQAHDVLFGALGARVALDLRFAAWAALRPQIELLPTVRGAVTHLQLPAEQVGDVTGTAGIAALLLF